MRKKPRIVVDARMVGPTGHGIANYVCDIASALQSRDLPYELFFLVAPHTPKHASVRGYEHRESAHPFLHPKEIFLLAKEIDGCGPDLYHSPSFSSLWTYRWPQAITVHDLNHLHFAGMFHKVYYHHLLLPAVARARAVASVSETSAAELKNWIAPFGLNPEVSVVPNAILPPPPNATDVLPRYGLEKDEFFLCLANAKPFKNVEFLKSAYRLARGEGKIPPLVLSIPGEDEEGIRHLGALPSEAVAPLLAGARAFFFPSLYEGFGRPPVEAALAGTLPVVSDIPVLREALRPVREARFFSPTELQPWADEFQRLGQAPKRRLSDETLRETEKSYSLEKVASAADAFYRRALGGI